MNTEILKYLNGQMSPNEQNAFNQRLDADETLSDELMSIVARESFKQDLKNEFKTWESENAISGQKIPFSKIAQIAAVLILIIGLSVVLIHYLEKPSHLIIAEYMEYPLPGNHRNSIANDVDQYPMSDAFDAFREANFEEAAKLFTGYSANHSLTNESNLYAGISLLWTKKQTNIAEAIPYFNTVLATTNDRNDAALYFLAIARYELKEKEEAKRLFQEIAADPNHFKCQQAKAILEAYF